MYRVFTFSIVIVTILLSGCKPEKKDAQAQKKFIVVKAFPHDITAFTQGLVIHDGRLFESTGQNNSWIAEVDISSGIQNKKVTLDKKYFGEGITILNNKIYQLTWQDHVGFIYDFSTFLKIGEFQNDREGWGLTHDDRNLIMSDGSDKVHFLDTVSLKIIRSIRVKENNAPQEELNELEYIDGYIYANQWQTNYILKIDPSNGNVVDRLDLTALTQQAKRSNSEAEVLNGIAYEKKSRLLLVTGKHWPVLFALKLRNDTTTVSNQ
ncbi:glutaminyl-peptide cyclotransferase [soil metagenome]